MEFIDLKSQQKVIRKALDNRLSSILDEGRYILGAEVHELEDELSNFQALNILLHVQTVLMH